MNGCTIFNDKLEAFCIDSDQKGKFVITAGSRNITLHRPMITEHCSSCHTKNIKETNVDVLRLNHFDMNDLKIAFTNISDLNVSKITESDIICIYSKSETGRKISDLDWCMGDENLLITTSNDHRAYIWDLREKNPVLWFSSLSKMRHGKFKKSNSGERQLYVAFSESTNIKVFDVRYPEKAYRNVYSHENIINDLQWDNLDYDVVVTVSDDHNIRYWDCNNFNAPIYELKSSLLPPKQFINSPCGKFFTTVTDLYFNQKMSYPSYTIWRRPADNSIFSKDFVDEKIRGGVWQYNDELMSELYFFYLTYSGKFCRRTLNSCHLGTEIESILHAPTIQKCIDIELDERITRYDSETLNSEYLMQSEESITNIGINNDNNIIDVKEVSLPKEIAVVNEYSRYIKIPYFDDNLLNELEALKNISTLELQAAEVNFSRAAVMLVYENIKVSFKLVMEIRFHCDFIINGNILISIYEKDCPLSTKKAEDFLERLQVECNLQKLLPKNKNFIEKMYNKKKIKKKNSTGSSKNSIDYKNTTFLTMVIRQIPKIIKEMNVFPEDFTDSSDSDFCHTDSDENVCNFENIDSANSKTKLLKNLSKSTHFVLDKIDHRTLTATFPFNYTPSSYDRKIHLPRKFGAYFSKSGHFITFGINSTYQAIIITEKINKNDKMNSELLNCDTKFRNQKGNKLHVFHINPREKLPKYRSMFKSLHHFREHLRKQFEKYILSFTWEKHEVTAYHLKLRKFVDMKERNEENNDEYLHTTNYNNKDLYNSMKQCYPFKTHGKVLYSLKESLSINDINKILLQKNDSLVLIKDYEREKHINICENNCVHLIDNDITQILSHIESRMLLNDSQMMSVWNSMKGELLKIMSQCTKGFKSEFTTEHSCKMAPLKFILQHLITSSDYHSVTLLSIILSRICVLKTKNVPLNSNETGLSLPLSIPSRSSYLSNYGYYRASIYYNLVS
uniref:WD_REPEATS_REGION domain-containing protein n=1 Tax=Strongyloides papillosus TaxID=174720 RepID=A0A0N5BVK4_STREA